MIEGYRKVNASGLNLIYIDAKEEAFEDFYRHFSMQGMFAEKKLIIITDLFSQQKFQEAFLEKLEAIHASKNIVVVYEREAVDARKKLFKDLLKLAKCQESTVLLPMQLKRWVQAEFEKQGVKIADDALTLLTAYVNQDTWRLAQEIKKLSSYKKGDTVTRADVTLQVRPNIENDIFKTIDALTQNKKQAIALLHKHLEGGDAPLYLLSMITYQFRNFLIVKDLLEKGIPSYQIAKKAGLHPFVVKKSVALCNQFSFQQLKAIYRKIFAIDEAIKTGTMDPEMALDSLLASI